MVWAALKISFILWVVFNNSFFNEKIGYNSVWSEISQKENINRIKPCMLLIPDLRLLSCNKSF